MYHINSAINSPCDKGEYSLFVIEVAHLTQLVIVQYWMSHRDAIVSQKWVDKKSVVTFAPELCCCCCFFFAGRMLSLSLIIARLRQVFPNFVLGSSFRPLLQSCFSVTITEMCEDFFCSRCKEDWVLQYKGGTKCLSNCPYGFYRKEDWYSDQSYCDSE